MTSETDSKTKGKGNTNGGGGEMPALERAHEVRERADDLARTVSRMAKEVHGTVAAQVTKRPYHAIALAGLAGFVLGGGLSVAVLRGATRMGLRFAMAALLEKAVGASST